MIDYARLARALEFYQERGYQLVDVPWMVPAHIYRITTPKNRWHTFEAEEGLHMVGSAEQGFLHLMLEGLLPPGKYVALTPCFRAENVDFLHQKRFMKVELFDNRKLPPMDRLNELIPDAHKFFAREFSPELLSLLKATDWEGGKEGSFSCDIELNGVELGSYGQRIGEFGEWVYGTGLAEPRFSKAVELLNRRSINLEFEKSY